MGMGHLAPVSHTTEGIDNIYWDSFSSMNTQKVNPNLINMARESMNY